MTQWTESGGDAEAIYDATLGHPVVVTRLSNEPPVMSIDNLQ